MNYDITFRFNRISHIEINYQIKNKHNEVLSNVISHDHITLFLPILA